MKFLTSIILLLYVGFFSGCNNGDTNVSEQAKSAEEPKKKLAEEVLVFLKGEEFSVSNVWTDESDSFGVSSNTWNQSKYTYDFEYDNKTETLAIMEAWQSDNDYSMTNAVTSETTHNGSRRTVLNMMSVDLKSCGPVIRIIDSNTNEDIKKVVLTGNYQHKNSSKKGEWKKKSDRDAAKEAGIETPEDWENLRKMDFDRSFKEKEIILVVKKDIAPRLKAALGDLLKAHGVEPSKY